MKHRILIVAEAVTLAHIGRPLALATVLEQLGHDVIFACSPGASRWLTMEARAFEPIWSVSSERFLGALARGAPLYDRPTLLRYVEEDLELIDRVRPDLVIGDFRLSLYVSAKLRKVPYGAVANAYWSPRYFERSQVPDIPLVGWLGVTLADLAFKATYRVAFQWHARPFVEVCKHFGVPSPGSSILDVYTASDCTALADAEEFYPRRGNGSGHEMFIGPLQWSPQIPLPAGHEQWGKDRPLVYVTLGSSGRPQLAERVLTALEDVPVDVVAATAGARLAATPRNGTILDFVPGDVLCRRASLVIGNGGSPIAYQALTAGVPLLGLASNLDQFLNMRMVERIGAGRYIRASNATADDIRKKALELLEPGLAGKAARCGNKVLERYDVSTRTSEWLEALRA